MPNYSYAFKKYNALKIHNHNPISYVKSYTSGYTETFYSHKNVFFINCKK